MDSNVFFFNIIASVLENSKFRKHKIVGNISEISSLNLQFVNVIWFCVKKIHKSEFRVKKLHKKLILRKNSHARIAYVKKIS